MEALPYSNMVIREAMRLYPPVWVISRQTIEADTLGGYTCRPAPTCSSVPIFCTGTRISGTTPEAFIPERFERSTRATAETDLPALLRRRAPLHRRDPGHLRDAGAPEPLRAPLPPAPCDATGGIRGADQPAHHTPFIMRLERTRRMPHDAQHAQRTDGRNRARRRASSTTPARTRARRVTYGELHERALGMLHHLQQLGAQPGDQLILLLNNNEQFIDAFWAAVLGGIVPVPVAIGISDEHRHKLLRIARKLGTPFIYTDRKTLERIGQFAAQTGDAEHLRRAAPARLPGGRPRSTSRRPARARPVPGDTAFIQFSSGSTSDPKGVVLTHANLIAN